MPFITGLDVGGAASPTSPTSSSPGLPPSSPTPSTTSIKAFDPSAFDLDSIYDRSGTSHLPPAANLRSCIQEAEPLYGDTKDELLKHSWSKCFVGSEEVASMSKYLFWWVLSKIIDSNHSNKEPEFEEDQPKQHHHQQQQQQQATASTTTHTQGSEKKKNRRRRKKKKTVRSETKPASR